MYLDPNVNDPAFTAERRSALKAPRPEPLLLVPRLANVEAFGAQLQRQLVVCRRTGQRSAVMMVALESRAGGERRAAVLAAAGARLRSRVRATDLVVQIGDDFGVFLQGDVARHASMIRERLRTALQADYGLHDALLQARPRFGLAIHAGTPISGVDLVIAAAMDVEP
jgi:GGDEF domain-containing protein